ncbi:MAG: hypothetical protein AAF988_06880 [Pseudomonadota bacterium]
MIETQDYLIALGGFISALFLFWIGKPIANKVGLVDKPGGRKQHEGAIPLIGGIVIFIVFAGTGLVADLNDSFPFWALMSAVLILLIVGVIDDRSNVLPWLRFAIQIAVAIFVVVFCGAEIQNLGNLLGFGDIDLGHGAKLFSVVCLVLLMNAFNMIDGLDGLAGGFMAIVLAWLFAVFYQGGVDNHAIALLLLFTPLMMFLLLNMRHPLRKKASVFLGDAGSLSLALLLGFFVMTAGKESGGQSLVPPVTIMWFVGLPVIDAFSIFFTRLKNGRHPFQADRLHLHYQLVDRGFSAGQATALLLALTFIFCLIGYSAAVTNIPEYIYAYSWSSLLLGYTAYNLRQYKQI